MNSLIVDVLSYRLGEQTADSGGTNGDLRSLRQPRTLGAFMVMYTRRCEGDDADGDDEEEGGGGGKYVATRSTDSKVYPGCSFSLPLLDGTRVPQGLKLQLYAVDGLQVVDLGCCKWKASTSSTRGVLIDRGYQVTTTLSIAPSSSAAAPSFSSVGKLTCRISIARHVLGGADRGHDEEKQTSDIKEDLALPPRFKFKAFTTPINWNLIHSLNLQRVVDENDGAALLACRRDVATGDLSSEEDVDPQLLKSIMLSQYTVQYLGSCKDVLESRRNLILESCQAFDEEEDALDMHLAKLRAKEAALRRECAGLDECRRDFTALLASLNPQLARDYDRARRQSTQPANDEVEVGEEERMEQVSVPNTSSTSASCSPSPSKKVVIDNLNTRNNSSSPVITIRDSPASAGANESGSANAWATQRSPQTKGMGGSPLPVSTHSPTKNESTTLEPAVITASPVKQQQQQQQQRQQQRDEDEGETYTAGDFTRKFNNEDDDYGDLPMQASLSWRASMPGGGFNRASVASSNMSVDSLGFGIIARQSIANLGDGRHKDELDKGNQDLVEAFWNESGSDSGEELVVQPKSPLRVMSIVPTASPPTVKVVEVATVNTGADDTQLEDLEDEDLGSDVSASDDEAPVYLPSSFARKEQATRASPTFPTLENERDDLFERSGDSLGFTAFEKEEMMRGVKLSTVDKAESVEVDLRQFGGGGLSANDFIRDDEEEDDDVVLLGTGNYRAWQVDDQL